MISILAISSQLSRQSYFSNFFHVATSNVKILKVCLHAWKINPEQNNFDSLFFTCIRVFCPAYKKSCCQPTLYHAKFWLLHFLESWLSVSNFNLTFKKRWQALWYFYIHFSKFLDLHFLKFLYLLIHLIYQKIHYTIMENQMGEFICTFFHKMPKFQTTAYLRNHK